MISSTELYLIIGFSVIGWVSYRRRKVDISGYVCILIFSAALILSSSYSVLTAISVTFVSSAIITTLKKRLIPRFKNDGAEDTPRNWKQATANMGLPVILVLSARINDEQSMTFTAFAALACATADTWSSEIGILSRSRPVLMLSRKNVPAGVSGGVTSLGLFCSMLGSLTIACVYYCYYLRRDETICILILGIIGSVIDSIIGELFQAKYLSQEKELTDTDSAGELVKGYRMITNNSVNLLAVSLTALIAFLVKNTLLNQ